MHRRTGLILGDVIAIGVLTVIGFASHGEADFSFIPRMGTTFFPVLISWLLIAPRLDLFDEDRKPGTDLFWRVPLAMLLAAPLAAVLRAAVLGSAALPIFTLVLGLTFTLGLLVWRVARGFILERGLL